MKPTDSQTNLLFKWLSWKLPRQEAVDATKWFENHADRKEASKEIARIHDLYHGNKLNRETLYTGKIWEGFNYD